jgi:DNA-binding response OmpR family regulator
MPELNQPTHIFIVENNKLYVRMLDYIFKKDFNKRFYNFRSEEEVLNHLHLRPDLVIIDESLPGSFDILTEVKKKDANTRVIIYSIERGLSKEFVEAGADDFVTKGEGDLDLLSKKTDTFLESAIQNDHPAKRSEPAKQTS